MFDVMLARENRDIFFPKLSANLHLITFSEIAIKYLLSLGLIPTNVKQNKKRETGVMN